MLKRHVVGLVVLGLLTFVMTVILSIPASFVFAHVNKAWPDFYADGVSGTLWDGQASNIIVRINGVKQAFGETQWTLGLWPLLIGKAVVTLDARDENQRISGKVTTSYPLHVELERVELKAPLSLLRNWYPLPIKVTGDAELILKTLEFDGENINELDGAFTWQQAGIDLGAGLTQLGSFLAVLSQPGEGAYQADVSQLKGQLGVSGLVSLNMLEKAYDAELVFKPEPGFDASMVAMIKQISKPQADGGLLLSYKGKL
jgi:hypothetical protein